jgi:phosphate-selective porin OprO/OprP
MPSKSCCHRLNEYVSFFRDNTMMRPIIFIASVVFCVSAVAAKAPIVKSTAGIATKSSTNNLENTLNEPFSIYYSKDGLTFSNTSKSFKTSLSGYIEFDAFKSEQGLAGFNSGTNVRRARLSLNGIVLQDWGYALSYELSSHDLRNANISYQGWQNQYLKVGQFLPNLELAGWTDNTATDFLELATPVNAFVPGYSQGIEYGVYNSQLAFHTSAYTAGSQEDVTGRSPLSIAGRFIYSPFHTETQVLEMGVSAWGGRPDGSKTTWYGSSPEVETHSGTTVVDTGDISDVKHSVTGDVETAYVQGPWNVQAEYLQDWERRDNAQPNLQFNGYYVLGSYFLTGESMKYDFPGGGFTGISPIHQPSKGAWQVLARWSYINLNDQDIRGGKENNIDMGLNWFANQFIRFKADYVHVMARPTKDGVDGNDNIFALEAQAQF